MQRSLSSSSRSRPSAWTTDPFGHRLPPLLLLLLPLPLLSLLFFLAFVCLCFLTPGSCLSACLACSPGRLFASLFSGTLALLGGPAHQLASQAVGSLAFFVLLFRSFAHLKEATRSNRHNERGESKGKGENVVHMSRHHQRRGRHETTTVNWKKYSVVPGCWKKTRTDRRCFA